MVKYMSPEETAQVLKEIGEEHFARSSSVKRALRELQHEVDRYRDHGHQLSREERREIVERVREIGGVKEHHAVDVERRLGLRR